MNKHLLGCVLFLSITLIGCGSTPTNNFKTAEINSPSLNEVTTGELGDTLVSYLFSTVAPSFRVTKNIKCMGAPELQVKSGTVLTPKNQNSTYEGFWEGMLCRHKKTGEWCTGQSGVASCNAFTCAFCSQDKEDFVPAQYVDVSQPNLRQELIYNGRVDDKVKFLYRELSAGYMRDAFSQEVQYDLKEGTEIGFKGARIKIIEATNRGIKYRVVKHFAR